VSPLAPQHRSTPWGALGLVLSLVLLVGCATPSMPREHSALRQAKPASILVLPPVNNTPDVLATPSVYSQLTRPLAESGYYVLPISLVDETLRDNGIQTPPEARAIPLKKLREIFGADAVLFVDVKHYGTVYRIIESESLVTVQGKLVDLRDGQLLWEGTAQASSTEQGSGNSGLLGRLIGSVIDQVLAQVFDRSHPLAGTANHRLLSAGTSHGLLPGPRSPLLTKAP
jgi:hypothetical protein